MPGDNVVMEVELIAPVAIEEGMSLFVKEATQLVQVLLIRFLLNR